MLARFLTLIPSLTAIFCVPVAVSRVGLSLCFILIICVGFSGKAAAQEGGDTCGFNAIGDWVCGGASGQSSVDIWGAAGGGGNPFTSIGNLNSLFGGMPIPSNISSLLLTLSGMLGGLDPTLQMCMINHIAGLDMNNVSDADINRIVAAALAAQAAVDSIPEQVNCPSGTVLNGSSAYQEQGLLNRFCNMRSSSITGGADTFIRDMLDDFMSSYTTDFCNAIGGGGTPGTPGTPTPPDNYGNNSSDGFAGETPPACMADGVNNWTQERSNTAFQVADAIRAGNGGRTGRCAFGVRSILDEFPDLKEDRGVGLGHAWQVPANLERRGYTHMPLNEASDAPVGCILVYDCNDPKPCRSDNGGGGGARYGHIEIVATRPNGARVYVSDYADADAGGTVPRNLLGCWYRHSAPEGATAGQCAPGGETSGNSTAGGGSSAAGLTGTPVAGLEEVVDGSCEPVNEATIDQDIARLVSLREGDGSSRNGRGCYYIDSEGHPTIGIGHLVVPGDPYGPGTCLTDPQMFQLFADDARGYRNAAMAQMRMLNVNSHEFLVVLTSVNFQLGVGWYREHTDTWQLMANRQFAEAAVEAADSRWARQTPTRVSDFQVALRNLDNCAG